MSGLAANAAAGLPPRLVFDFSQLSFIQPAGITFLSNLVHWLAASGCQVLFAGLDRGTEALRYLDDSLFFEQHLGRKLHPFSCPRDTTRPLQKIVQAESHAWLRMNLMPWLAARLNVSDASLRQFQVSVSEIFNNIENHTRYDIGSIFVQHFPRQDRVNISVSDFGHGIPESVRKVINLPDAEAIIKATEEGFTTKSIPQNAGIGLDYLLKSVVLANGGTVTIYSLRGIVRFMSDGTRVIPYAFPHTGYCPGTTIDINLRTDTIEVLEDESEDLQW